MSVIEITKTFFRQSQVTYMEMQENNKLSLSMVRSRTFLDCLPEGKVVYTCVGQVNANSVEDILVDTAIDVKPIPHAIFRAGEGEMYGNPNAIDFADKEIDFLIQPNLNGCFASKQMGKFTLFTLAASLCLLSFKGKGTISIGSFPTD